MRVAHELAAIGVPKEDIAGLSRGLSGEAAIALSPHPKSDRLSLQSRLEINDAVGEFRRGHTSQIEIL